MREVILLVEDDYALAMGTEYALQAEGYEVRHAGNLEAARAYWRQAADETQKPNLILLDVMLPDGNGYDFCREVRRQDAEIPIIFLTAVGEEVNIVQGLELGADDYVTKPYRVKELLSRIAANLRRSRLHEHSASTTRQSEKAVFCFGSHSFYMWELRLMQGDRQVELTPSELRLLRELIQNKGQILTRNQLLEKLYDTGDTFVDNNTLSVYMKRLRDKLGEDAEHIETVRGIGYRFRKDGHYAE